MKNETITTIKITQGNRDKLGLLKQGRNISYDKIIEELLSAKGGLVIDDVINIEREPIAFTLRYVENGNVVKMLDVTFKELRNAKVGDNFVANDKLVNDRDYITINAEIINKTLDGDVILVLTEVLHTVSAGYEYNNTIMHVKLF